MIHTDRDGDTFFFIRFFVQRRMHLLAAQLEAAGTDSEPRKSEPTSNRYAAELAQDREQSCCIRG